MPATLTGPAPGIREFLSKLPPGTVVAQLDDGSIEICQSLEEADRKIMASAVKAGRTSGRRLGARAEACEH
jgi:hypothetical protein